MPSSTRPRTVLQVSKTDDGEIEISLLIESQPATTQSLVIAASDAAVLIDMLRQHVGDGDPEDRSTLRNLRPVTSE